MVRTKMVEQDYTYIRRDSKRLEEEMMDHMAKQMAEDVDFELIGGLLEETGWTKVVLRPMTWETGDAIDLWMLKNCKGQYKTRGLVWLFERSEDAMWFKLRWMGSD